MHKNFKIDNLNKNIPINSRAVNVRPKHSTALIKGLENGTVLLNNNIPGAYDGMLVEIATL